MSKGQVMFLDALSPIEEDFMRALWNMESGVEIRDVLLQMEHSDTPYTTIASVAQKLEGKGYIKKVGKKRGFLYAADVTQSEYYNHTLRYVVSNFFRGSYKNLVQYFAAEQKVSKEEIEDVLRLIEEGSDPSDDDKDL